MAATRRSMLSDVVKVDNNWLKHINTPDAATSHRMFTSESYYRSLWDSSLHAILIVDAKGDIIEANRYCLELMETTGADVESANLRDLIPDSAWESEYADFKTVLNGQRYKYLEEREILSLSDKRKRIPVRVVVTRVPSSLSLPFQHSIIHIYEMVPLSDIDSMFSYKSKEESMQEKVKDLTWGQIAKLAVTENSGWIVTIILFIIMLTALGGSLGAVIEKSIDHIYSQPPTQEKVEKPQNSLNG